MRNDLMFDAIDVEEDPDGLEGNIALWGGGQM